MSTRQAGFAHQHLRGTVAQIAALSPAIKDGEIIVAEDTISGDTIELRIGLNGIVYKLAGGSGSGGITSLNGLTGATQTFTDDTNVTVVSGGTAHVVTWAGTLAVARGGTGSSTASGARTALGLVIGTDVQAYDADLAALAGLTSAADKLPYFTGAATAAVTDFSSFARTLVDDATASAARTTLGVVIGTDVQAYDATLAALAAYNTNGIVCQTAADTFAGRTLTGTTDVITVSNGDGVSGNPTITIASTYAGQTSIVTLGTVSTGTWQSTVIDSTYGGTGVNNAGRTLTISGNSGTINFQSAGMTLGMTGSGTGNLAFASGMTLSIPATASVQGTNTGDQVAASQNEQETGSSTTVFVAPGRQQYHASAAKAWCVFDGTAGTISNAASYNMDAPTDNGTGDYTLNWTTDFSSGNYCVTLSVCDPSFALASAFAYGRATPAAGTLRIAILKRSDGSLLDYPVVYAAAFGDQ